MDSNTASLTQLETIHADLLSQGHSKLANETQKMISQVQWGLQEKWGNLSCREIFDKMDEDRDNILNEEDLYAAFRELQMPGFTTEDISAIFKLGDTSGTGKLNWEDFNRTFAIPDPTQATDHMGAEERLEMEVHSSLIDLCGYDPGPSAARTAINNCREMDKRQGAINWFLNHTEDWFNYIDNEPYIAPPGDWRCFTGEECQKWGGTWNKKDALFCIVCKKRNPNTHSNWSG